MFVFGRKGDGQWRRRRAAEDVAGLLKVLLRERLAAVPDRLGLEGQMVFD